MMQTTSQPAPQTATPGSGARLIREVKRKTYKRYTSEEKIRIVLEGFRKEIPVSDLCRREGLKASIYYKWLKDFMEAGKARLRGDSLRETPYEEVVHLKKENEQLKEFLGDQALQLYLLKKRVLE